MKKMNFLQIVFIDSGLDPAYEKLLNQSSLVRDVVCQYFKRQFGFCKTFLTIDCEELKQKNIYEDYVILSNGNFYTDINGKIALSCIKRADADVVTITAEPLYKAYSEVPKLTSDGKIAGFSRLFSNACLESFSPTVANHIAIKKDFFNKHLSDKYKSIGFENVFKICKENSTAVKHYNVSGNSASLQDCREFYKFFKIHHKLITKDFALKYKKNYKHTTGDVLYSDDVQIDEGVRIIGPSIICSKVHIKANSIISGSIIAANIEIKEDSVLKNAILCENSVENSKEVVFADFSSKNFSCKGFKKWNFFSYPIIGKRIFDIIFSLIMIILFGPIWLLVSIVIKLNSPGPLFYKAVRQGVGGKEFKCLKFRSMITGADDMQRILRVKNEVDGPQFKIADDPRISPVGAFLRDTSLDEIPQFFNVLAGQMTVVGPRPSPETENMQCPYWRDARLSVKPGITGLWQIMRTREPSKDFQEWVYYDTKYVREISFKKDLWICYKTAMMLIREFVDRF